MNDVLDVANYVINYCNERNISITQLKLQKLLYFIQVRFLIQINRPCFNEEIIALPYGPVVGTVIERYREFGATELTVTSDINLNLDEQDLINEVLNMLAKYRAGRLVEITHNQSPWRDAYSHGIGTVITHQAILNYFRSN